MSLLLLLLAAAAAGANEETPFEPSARIFADAAACKAFLAGEAATARRGSFDAVEGPYDLATGDVRIHTVRSEGVGHRIHEQRCLAEKLSGRSWSHAMAPDEPEFTVESVARTAEWLKKGARQ
ncbi:MAG TPA: hypothetical protein VGB59_02390 [Allosphingosinicella sp.]|jgi:hypothetical protein